MELNSSIYSNHRSFYHRSNFLSARRHLHTKYQNQIAEFVSRSNYFLLGYNLRNLRIHPSTCSRVCHPELPPPENQLRREAEDAHSRCYSIRNQQFARGSKIRPKIQRTWLVFAKSRSCRRQSKESFRGRPSAKPSA